MSVAVREIIEIDEDLCDGCEKCIPACAEGAIQMVNGKAKLVNDSLCDGIGNCLGDCPQGAITIIRREAADYDEKMVEEHLTRLRADEQTAGGNGSRASVSRKPAEYQSVSPAAPVKPAPAVEPVAGG